MMILCLSALLLAFPQAATPAAANSAAVGSTAAVPTPADASERIAMGHQVNGLHDIGVPFHVLATWEWFGPDGHSKDKGTFEEWNAGPTRFRVAVHSPEISVEQYGTDHGVFRRHGQAWPPMPVSSIQRLIDAPLPAQTELNFKELKNYERNFGAGKMQCTALLRQGAKRAVEDADSYCFAPANAVVFYAGSNQRLYETLFDHFMIVHGRYLAHDMQMFVGGSPWLKVHIDTVRALTPVELAALMPPADADPVPARVYQPENIAVGRLLKKQMPQYPVAAKDKRVQGRVAISCIVDKTGHPTQLSVLGGPLLLQDAALDAVRQWVWSPYLHDGQPVEVEMLISVVFALGG